jgi:hypothetical protein
MTLLKSFNTFIRENLENSSEPADVTLPKEWIALQSLVPAENFKPYDITQHMIAQGGKVPEKTPAMFWKSATKYLEISLNKNGNILIKYSNDNKTGVGEIQNIFDKNGIRDTSEEFNGSDIEAAGTISVKEINKTADIINQVLAVMGITK